MQIAFAISMLLSFWVVMDTKYAIISTVGYCLFGLQWYRYCLRIYNKFYIGPLIDLKLEMDSVVDPVREVRAKQLTEDSTTTGKADSSTPASSVKKSFFSKLGIPSMTTKARPAAAATGSSQGEGQAAVDNTPVVPSDMVWMEGFLSLDDSYSTVGAGSGATATTATTAASSGHNWVRKYLVLNKEAELYIYPSKKLFRSNPEAPERTRPIVLPDYDVINYSGSGSSADGSSSQLVIRLTVKEKLDGMRPWLFRCDSDIEFEDWLKTLSEASLLELY